jgi:molybdopterin-guanine dinucleotide biosynthesis protein A
VLCLVPRAVDFFHVSHPNQRGTGVVGGAGGEYHAAMSDIAAFVLAGGRSLRMGRDKAFLELQGRTLLERALTIARNISDNVRIVGPREKFAPYGPVIEDVYPGQGPLAGIHAALTTSQSELNFMVALDTPFLDAGFARYLVEQASVSAATVTVPRVAGRVQPLCAVYRRAFAAVAENALRQERNNIVPLFAAVTTREIDDAELRRLAYDPRMFDNLNTPEEWDQACKRAQR